MNSKAKVIEQLRFDYAALDAETRMFVEERTERIHNLARMTAAGIVQIGQYLTEVKARLKHGQFLVWIEREFAWKERSAQNFMNVYHNVTPHLKSATVADLQVEFRALYLIASPSMPEPVRTEVIRRAEAGETVSNAGTRALVQRFAETGQLPEVTTSLSKMIEGRRALQPQPRPQPPSPEEQQARAEQEELRARMRANGERTVRVFNVIGSIECLCATPLTVPEIAAEIRRLDTPDKDWCGQLKLAQQRLSELDRELDQ